MPFHTAMAETGNGRRGKRAVIVLTGERKDE